jgi:release factor glutamine methyltransferase
VPPGLRNQLAVITANVPYVPTGKIATMPPEARDYEPTAALDGGKDGLDLARRVATEAPAWLRPGGALLIEASTAQADHAAEIFAFAGLTPTVVYDDELGATVVAGVARA